MLHQQCDLENNQPTFALGRHLIIEYYDCNNKLILNNALMLKELFHSVAKSIGATIINSSFHPFEPQGVSGYILISESHFSVHTWPEHKYAAVDIFTCGTTIEVEKGVALLKHSLGSERSIISGDMSRGLINDNKCIPKKNINICGKDASDIQEHISSWKQLYAQRKAWGILTSLDITECNPLIIRDAAVIKGFVYELCDRIKVKRFGECTVVNFGENERIAGFSMTQLIETSLISGHFSNATNTSYLDIFSCKYYEPREVAEYALRYFMGKNYTMHVTLRE